MSLMSANHQVFLTVKHGLMLSTKSKVLNPYHFESNESIEASLVIWPDPSDDDAVPQFPSACLAEPSPMCEGFHDESLTSSPSLD